METEQTPGIDPDKSRLSSTANNPTDKQVLQRLSELDLLREFQNSSGGSNSNLIGLLQKVQDSFGYLPPPALREISRRTGIRLSRIYGVVSFYAQFYTAPRGRHTVRCCRGTACHVKGAPKIIDAVRKTLNIDEGQTTSDMKFCLEGVACVGTCFLAPVMMIDNQYFGKLTPKRVESILQSYQAKES